MPLPVRIAAPRRSTTPAPVPDLREPSGGTAMSPGPAAVVAAATQVGNAAVTTALGGRPPSPSAWGTRMLLAGQDLVGNQAVTAAGATAAPATAPERPRPPEKRPATKPVRKAKAPPARAPEVKDTGERERGERPEKKERTGPRSPGADPKFQALKQDVAAKKRRVASSHPPPAVEAGAAQGAAVPPPDDREARGKAAHAEDMDAAQPKEFDKQSFIAAVEKAIRDRAPKNLDEADKFGDSGKAEEVKTEVAGKVGEGKDASSAEIADTTAATPEPAPDAKTVVPLAADQLPGRPGTPNPRQATPDPLPKSATDLSAGPAKVDRQLDSAGVTEKQLSLKNSREPSFDKAVRDKKALEKHSATAPRRMRAGESRELGEVRGAAAASGTAAMGAIHASRATTGRQVTTGKKGTKDRDEDRRTKVTALLQKVFDRTKTDVEKILKDLDEAVDDQFTKGEKTARTQFTAEHTRGMEEYKDRRYSGLRGKARWVKDLFADLPDEANRIYERARDNYLTAMRQVISDVADTVVRELTRAKDRIAKGRAELKQAVDDLPKDLKAIGREAASDFAGKFDELRDSVDDKGTELVDTLATKYTDAVKAVDKEIAEEKEKNKGLASKAVAAVKGAIETIKELGRMLMGVLRKAASAVGLILKDPVGFLGRLITGVAGGLRAFMKDAGRYLQQGVLAWLLGSGVGGGLQLPATFDVLGIVVLLAGLLGLSWANIRARLAKRVSPKTMTAAETGKDAIPLVVEVRKRGVAGMWNDLRGRVGDLKKDLIKNLVSYLLPTIIIAGITWIVSLFNPASAFIRACKMIIDIIRFIVTQGRQIIEFVNAVLDAVIAIARGTANVTGTIVKALARSIPVLIGALAAILGVGGIAGRVRQIFQRLSRPVNRAIDKVITKIQGLLKKLAAKLKPKKPKKPRKPRKPKRPKDTSRRRRPRKPTRPRRRRDRDRRPDSRRDKRKDKKRKQSAAEKRKVAKAAANEAARRIIGVAPKDVETVLRSVLTKWRKKGLRRLRIKNRGGALVVQALVNPLGEGDQKSGYLPPKLATERAGQHADTGRMTAEQALAKNETWARGVFILRRKAHVRHPTQSGEMAQGRLEKFELPVGYHAEEAIIKWYRPFFELAKISGRNVEIELEVNRSSCVNCSAYIASQIKDLVQHGCRVSARFYFTARYEGGQEPNPSAPHQRPTRIPESTATEYADQIEQFYSEGKLVKYEREGLPEAGRYEDAEGFEDPNQGTWYELKRGRKQAELALAILYSAHNPPKATIEIATLGEERLDTSAGPVSPAQQLQLGKKNKRMADVIDAVKKKLGITEAK